MRDIFHDELDAIGKIVIQMTKAVAVAMDRATAALLDANLALAEQVMAGDDIVDALRSELEERCFQIIAMQAPVAGDLRIVISTIHLGSDLERMGDLATHVAKIARLRYPEVAVPPEVRDVFGQMGQVARSLIGKVVEVVDGHDISIAQAIEAEDDSMDALRRKLFTIILSENWTRGTEPAIDTALLGRYYERYADHAVAVARQVRFIVTGKRV